MRCYKIYYYYFLLGSFKNLQPLHPMFLRGREKKKRKERALKPVLGYIIPRLVLAPPILVLLVGKSVTTQAPSNNHNTSNNNTSSKKKFKAKKNVPLSTLSNREEFFYN